MSPAPSKAAVMAAPAVVVVVAGLAAVVMGSLIADMFGGGDWSGLRFVGWLVAASSYGPFLAFYFWIDARMVRARAGQPFATGGASSLHARTLS